MFQSQSFSDTLLQYYFLSLSPNSYSPTLRFFSAPFYPSLCLSPGVLRL